MGTTHLGPFRPSPQQAPLHLGGQGLLAVCASGPGRSRQRCLSSGALMKPTAGSPQDARVDCSQFSGLESWNQGVGRPGAGAGPFPSLQVAASHCVFSGQWERDGDREMETDRKREKQRVRDGAWEQGQSPPGHFPHHRPHPPDLSEPSSLPRRPPSPTQHQVALGEGRGHSGLMSVAAAPGHAASPC